MALILNEKIAGITANYWKIFKISQDFNTNESVVRIALYVSKEARDESIGNVLKHDGVILKATDLTREKAYTELKKPVYEEQPNPEYTEEKAKTDDKLKPTITVQVNKFVNAEDELTDKDEPELKKGIIEEMFN